MKRNRVRFPRIVFGVGEEPDPRFTFANERTFLAWNRTALALIAGGVALEAFALELNPQLRFIASLILILAGILVPVASWIEWVRAERAMRCGWQLPGAGLAGLLAAVIAVVGVLIAIAAALRG